MSPLLYSTTMQSLRQATEALLDSGSSQAESDLSTSPSLPALREIEQSSQQQHLNTNTSQDYNQTYSGEWSEIEERIRHKAYPSGDTVASTSSYLSEIEIYGIGNQLDNMKEEEVSEIPFRESEDPPDDWERNAALSVGETEHWPPSI